MITGAAGGQLAGDWAQGEFQGTNQVAGKDYTGLPGLGLTKFSAIGGDAFYIPVNKDPKITAAQKRLPSALISKELQVAYNLKKGSLPIRGDIDLAAANDCMKQGIEILASGNVLPSSDQVTVRENLTYGLKNAKMPKEEIKKGWPARSRFCRSACC